MLDSHASSGDVRHARSEDLALLPEVERASDRLFADRGISPLPPVTVELEELARARAILVVGDPVAGFARLEEVDGAAHLEQLSVHPDHARRGLGAALLRASIEWAAAQGYPALTLCTFADVPWNAPFYRRHGFHEVADLSPGLRAIRATEGRLGLDRLGRRVVMRRLLTDPRTAEEANGVLADVAASLRGTLGCSLLGLYAHGSWVAGDFAPERSDLDLLAVLAEEPDAETLSSASRVHADVEGNHPAWRGRIEVEYVARATVAELVAHPDAGAGQIMRVSPGEALRLLPATSHRLLTWASVREYGRPLVGVEAPDLLPPIDAEVARRAVLDHVRDWPQWARGMEHPGGQAYSVLTLCRAWCLFAEGVQVSKLAAAERVLAGLPEWAEIVRWARDWWYAAGRDDAPSRWADVVAFVDDVSARILVGAARV